MVKVQNNGSICNRAVQGERMDTHTHKIPKGNQLVLTNCPCLQHTSKGSSFSKKEKNILFQEKGSPSWLEADGSRSLETASCDLQLDLLFVFVCIYFRDTLGLYMTPMPYCVIYDDDIEDDKE